MPATTCFLCHVISCRTWPAARYPHLSWEEVLRSARIPGWRDKFLAECKPMRGAPMLEAPVLEAPVLEAPVLEAP
jgi:hypothetical protein